MEQASLKVHRGNYDVMTGLEVGAEYGQQLAEADNALERSLRQFAPLRWNTPVLLNSLFKSGTHLLRNILLHFCPGEEQNHGPFLFGPEVAATSRLLCDGGQPRLFVGHLPFIPTVLEHVRPMTQILLYRDPRTWVLAQGRQYYQPDQECRLSQWVQSRRVPLRDWIEVLITGGTYFEQRIEPLFEVYATRVLPWMSRAACIVRFEDLVGHLGKLESPAAERFFGDLLAACRLTLPHDWRDRVRAGSSRELSATNSKFHMDPELDCRQLLPQQQAMIDCLAPGLRALLGYA